MTFIGSKSFYSQFIEELHVNMKPLYALINDKIMFHQNNDLETLFRQVNTSITEDFTSTLPNGNHLFFSSVVLSLNGMGCVYSK